MPLSRILVLYEMQTILFRIWTLVEESAFSSNNRYATSASSHYWQMLETRIPTIQTPKTFEQNYININSTHWSPETDS